MEIVTEKSNVDLKLPSLIKKGKHRNQQGKRVGGVTYERGWWFWISLWIWIHSLRHWNLRREGSTVQPVLTHSRVCYLLRFLLFWISPFNNASSRTFWPAGIVLGPLNAKLKRDYVGIHLSFMIYAYELSKLLLLSPNSVISHPFPFNYVAHWR